jgi:O-6-methylguanine DNA methyltransferase
MSKKFDYDGSFKARVESVVRAIPKGHTQSYKEVAILAGAPQGARAVARIMVRNYDLTIPCHRVIKSDGTLGGYNRGGEKAKRFILESEGWVRG